MWSCLVDSIITHNIHLSATTLKPLTAEVNNSDHLFTLKCFSLEILGTGINVDATWHAPPTETLLRTKYPTLMATALPDGSDLWDLFCGFWHLGFGREQVFRRWVAVCERARYICELASIQNQLYKVSVMGFSERYRHNVQHSASIDVRKQLFAK